MEKQRILFISRTYPPTVGGIENQNFELYTWLSKIAEVKLIANPYGKKFLPFFLPWAIWRALWLMRKYDALLLGDGVLGIVGYKVKFFYRKKSVLCVLHGLDLTFRSKIYQDLWVKCFLQKLDKFICVGQETMHVAKNKGFPDDKLVFIPNGVDTEKNLGDYNRGDLEKVLGDKLENKKTLLTSGRLAKRKGVAWFIRNILPKLQENILYVVAGDGPDRENIQKAIDETQTGSRVKMLGRVTDEVRNILFNTSDIFIQPNIEVEGDMEGFGISVIEAASCHLPVIASRLEGLQDAIKDSQNGFLVAPGVPQGFIDKITELLDNETFRKEFGEKARQFTIQHYSWQIIANRYLEEIHKLIKIQ